MRRDNHRLMYCSTHVMPTKAGAFKVYFGGQGTNHFQDWNGTNYRVVSVPGQPARGFKTLDEALAWTINKLPSDKAAAALCESINSLGRHEPDNNVARWDIHWDKWVARRTGPCPSRGWPSEITHPLPRL